MSTDRFWYWMWYGSIWRPVAATLTYILAIGIAAWAAQHIHPAAMWAFAIVVIFGPLASMLRWMDRDHKERMEQLRGEIESNDD